MSRNTASNTGLAPLSVADHLASAVKAQQVCRPSKSTYRFPARHVLCGGHGETIAPQAIAKRRARPRRAQRRDNGNGARRRVEATSTAQGPTPHPDLGRKQPRGSTACLRCFATSRRFQPTSSAHESRTLRRSSSVLEQLQFVSTRGHVQRTAFKTQRRGRAPIKT